MRVRRTRALALALGPALDLLAGSATGLASPLPARSALWQAIDCADFDLVDVPAGVDCGYVSVPRRHDDPAGPTIELATVVLRAPEDDRAAEPVFLAQGGPGGSSIASFAQLLIDEPELRLGSHRDHVVWDQRGTLFSNPALLCPEATEAALEAALETAPRDPDPDPELLAFRECGERLAAEAGDLSAFNTVENAHDVEALRIALGYDRIDFYGVSYGTQLGQYLMRQHPGSLRAVILDAVVPTGFSLVTDTPFVVQRIGEKYFRACASDPGCEAAFPSLGPRLTELLDRLDREPVVLATTDPWEEAGESYRVKLTGELLGDLLYGALYIPEAHPVVPLVVDLATKGDFSLVESLLLADAFFDFESAEGMYLAVVCAERGDADPGAADYSSLAPRIAARGRREAQETLAVCRDWEIDLLPREVLEPVASDIPTLLLSGAYDPITPPELGERVAAPLSRAHHVVFPTGAHGQAFGEACATDLIRRFLDRPDAAPDAACAAVPAERFVLPDDLILLPALAGLVADGDLRRATRRVAPLLGALLVLATALVVYPVGWIARALRGEARPRESAAAAISRWAPWLAVGTFFALSAFVRSLVGALERTAETAPALLYLGAVPREERWIFGLGRSAAALAVVIAVVALVLWAGRQRSLAGRIYYTLLALAALGGAASLGRLGLLWP